MKYDDLKQIPQEGDIVGLEFGDVMIEGKFVEYLDDGIVLEMNNKGERLLKEFLPLKRNLGVNYEVLMNVGGQKGQNRLKTGCLLLNPRTL